MFLTKNNRYFNKVKLNNSLFFIISLYLVPVGLVFAQDESGTKQELGQVLINISQNVLPNITGFLSGLTVVAGIIFIFLAMFKLKHLADFRNMMMGQQEVGKAIGLIVLGGVFIWMPFMIDAFTYSMFGMTAGGLQQKYPIAGGSSGYYIAFYRLMQVVGLVSFVRGWFILAGAVKGQHQPGTFGKAVTHMLSGVVLINLKPFMVLLAPIFGQSAF